VDGWPVFAVGDRPYPGRPPPHGSPALSPSGSDATREAQGESLFFSVVPLGLDQLVGLDGFYLTERQWGGGLSVHGEKADRLHLRVGNFEVLVAIARTDLTEDEPDQPDDATLF